MAAATLLSTRLLLVVAATTAIALNLFPTNVYGAEETIPLHVYADDQCRAELRIAYRVNCGSCHNIRFSTFKFYNDPTGYLVYNGKDCKGKGSVLTASDKDKCFLGSDKQGGVSLFFHCPKAS
ncbi:hypothetical protein Sjap_005655 [Stephania japonica]|uniref:Uncharacterized protein n=1 Tax=Stephania japonica TaxID=461633 RepID=A0AAP0K4J9_9MAGN